MKIGFFTETYHPTVNGVVVSVDTFKAELEKLGHECFVFAPRFHDLKEEKSNTYRFPSISFPNDTVYPLAAPMPISQAFKHLPLDIISQLDVIHIQHFSMMGQYGIACGKKFNIPTIYTYHTMAELYTSYLPVLGVLVRPALRALTRYTARRAKHVITPTASIRDYLHDIGVYQPISVVPTGIHTANYKPTPRVHLEHYKIPYNRDILLFVGRLAKEKNIDFLLDAFQQVLMAQPDTQLMLVGDGPDRQRYTQVAAQKGLANHITFTGFLPREETIRLFGAADLFVFPSVTDTQGIVVIEAMAAGAVPVAVDRLGPHDLIRDHITGRLSDLKVDDFSSIIIDLLQHPATREKMATAARQQAKLYDQKETAKALETVYERLTRHPRSR